ncbi:MFS transporter [Blautia sp.]
MNNSTQTYSKKFIWRQRIGFGISDYACNLAYLMVNTYLLIFYTDVAGIPAASASIMFLITKFVDAFTDYLVGSLVDRTNTKMGRNRPWMLAGAPVLAIGMVLVFTTPDFSVAGKIAWAYATYIIFSFGYTLVNIPMGSILPTLSADATERTKIATTRTVFSNLGSLTSASMALWLIAKLGNGDQATGYRNTNIVFGIMVIVILLICVASIREINLPPRTTEKSSIVKDFGCLIKNKPYMLMITYTFFFFLAYLGMFASIAYYFKYNVGNEMLTSVAVTLLTVIPIFSMLIAAKMNAKITKRNITILGIAIQIAGSVVAWISGGNAAIVLIGVGLLGFGMGFRSNMYFSMLADVADYGEWQSGRNLAGTQMAVNGFSNKVSSACASAIVAGLLAWGAYDGTAAVQSAKANTAISIAFIALPIVANIAGIVVMWFYDLDKKYDKVEKELKERRAQVSSVES